RVGRRRPGGSAGGAAAAGAAIVARAAAPGGGPRRGGPGRRPRRAAGRAIASRNVRQTLPGSGEPPFGQLSGRGPDRCPNDGSPRAAGDGLGARRRARLLGRTGRPRQVAGRTVDGGARRRPRRGPGRSPARPGGAGAPDLPEWKSTLGARLPYRRPRPGLPWHPTLPLVDGRGGRPSRVNDLGKVIVSEDELQG